jgi:hypothetical protein
MRRLRTLRQRRRRARSGQVSAVATLLGLLLTVSFLATYVLGPLPSQMETAEFQHILQVENQLERLQARILAQALNPTVPLALASPVTLGSQAVPPFGAPSSGSISEEPAVSYTKTDYAVERVVPHPPAWNMGSLCLQNGSGHCTENGATFFWNITGQENSSFTITVNSNNNNLVYNISASNDTINIDWTGGDTGFVAFIINGSNDVVNYQKGGSDTNNPVASFLFWGQHDTFNLAFSGSHAGGGGMTLYVQFVGQLTQICPYGNISATDRVGTLSGTGSDLNMSAVWWNMNAYVSAPHTQPFLSGANDFVSWSNRTGFVNCAFSIGYTSHYTAEYLAGFRVHLADRYLPPADVVYDQGAVIESQDGGGSVMVSPPEVTIASAPSGLTGRVTLIDVVGNVSLESGFETAAVLTRVLSVDSYSVINGASTQYLASLFFNVTTAYPRAWYTWMTQDKLAFPGGPSCFGPAFPAPYSCLNPPSGTVVTISAAMAVQQLTLTTVVVQVGIG